MKNLKTKNFIIQRGVVGPDETGYICIVQKDIRNDVLIVKDEHINELLKAIAKFKPVLKISIRNKVAQLKVSKNKSQGKC